jgi:hypothetical protein
MDAENLDLAYKTANGLIGSENDNGIDNAANIVSTESFMPYNKGTGSTKLSWIYVWKS